MSGTISAVGLKLTGNLSATSASITELACYQQNLIPWNVTHYGATWINKYEINCNAAHSIPFYIFLCYDASTGAAVSRCELEIRLLRTSGTYTTEGNIKVKTAWIYVGGHVRRNLTYSFERNMNLHYLNMFKPRFITVTDNTTGRRELWLKCGGYTSCTAHVVGYYQGRGEGLIDNAYRIHKNGTTDTFLDSRTLTEDYLTADGHSDYYPINSEIPEISNYDIENPVVHCNKSLRTSEIKKYNDNTLNTESVTINDANTGATYHSILNLFRSSAANGTFSYLRIGKNINDFGNGYIRYFNTATPETSALLQIGFIQNNPAISINISNDITLTGNLTCPNVYNKTETDNKYSLTTHNHNDLYSEVIHNHAHNSLTGLNDGTDYEHLTETEKNNMNNLVNGSSMTSAFKLMMLNFAYPIGTIYTTVSESINPATAFGGTWEKIQNRFLIAAGNEFATNSTGGSKTQTLVMQNMPQHSHGVEKINTMTESVKGVTDSNRTIIQYVSSDQTEGIIGHDNTTTAFDILPPYIAVNVFKRTA